MADDNSTSQKADTDSKKPDPGNQIREVYEKLKTSIRKDKTHDTEREIP
ncbi:MAG: hypothetical protein SPL57_00900 [Lachnospiraceae bacterium]|nr:hypothetical protein [Lachnospiraceae bacterium]